MKVTISTLQQTNRDYITLANSPLPPKPKYWVGRIAKAAYSALQEFEKIRFSKIRELGEPIKYEPQPDIEVDGVMTPQQPLRVVITDADEAAKPTTMWEVKPENMPAFTEWHDAELAKEVDIPFDQIKLDAMGDAPIGVQLANLEWMIEA